MGDQFLGVYTTHEVAPAMGEFPRPGVRKKRWWFVWRTANERYKVQPLNAVLQPMTEPRVISTMEFDNRYTLDEECPAVPAGYARAGAEGEIVAVPEDTFAYTGPLAADDPNLLLHWSRTEDAATDASSSTSPPVEIVQLMGEILPAAPVGSTMTTPVANSANTPSSTADDMVKLLRGRFVQALLRLRRGERAESMADLSELLSEPHVFFEGGAQLFSEIGLGLRRLGFVRLALVSHKRALEFAPRDARVLFNIARSCHDLDLVLEAKDFLEQALAVEPDFVPARQFMGFLDAGRQSQKENQTM